MVNKFFNKSKSSNKELKTDSKIKQEVQDFLVTRLNQEFSTAKQNLQDILSDGDEYYKMIHCQRDKKLFDDEPDIYLPEYVSRLLTQIGNFNAQYFGSRDYVDVYLESDNPVDVAESRASKRLLNAILNLHELHHYYKITRLMMTVKPKGYGVLKGNYVLKTKKEIIRYDERQEYVLDEEGNFLDEAGEIFSDAMTQRPQMNIVQDPVYQDVIEEDYPNFDVYPNRDVFFSPEYTYSLQDKKYVIFCSEQSIQDLMADKERCGYFNLDLLEKTAVRQKTDKDGKEVFETVPSFYIRERWGKEYVVVKEWDERGKPITYEPGYDKYGDAPKDAEPMECIKTTASWRVEEEGNHQLLIRFQVSPHSKRPMVRFINYVDEIMDTGFGDGEANIELQTADNDLMNLAFYRAELSTKPAFKGKQWKNIPDKVRVHSEDVIRLEDMDDLEELEIDGDITSALNGHAVLTGSMDRTMAIYSPTMGASPQRRETATMASIVDQRASIRMGLQNLNLEFIGFTGFYDMILTLCNDFMQPETLINLIGEQDAYNYNPNRKDRFKPVTQALENEQSKNNKLKTWQNLYGMSASLPNPRTPMVLNYIMGQMLELMGGDFKAFKKFMFSENPREIAEWLALTGNKGMANVPQPQPMMPPQNQRGLPQTPQEQQARGPI